MSGKFHPKNHYDQLFFPQKKKKNASDIAKWSFIDFETEPETPFGNRKFFFRFPDRIPGIGMKICTRVFGVSDNLSVIRFS